MEFLPYIEYLSNKQAMTLYDDAGGMEKQGNN